MSRPLSERVKDWKCWGEQVAHFIAGGIIAYAFAFDSPWAIGCPLSIGAGLLREIVQNVRFGPFRWDGSLADAGVDVAFWTVGAVIGSLIA
jgi:hypothetical protein